MEKNFTRRYGYLLPQKTQREYEKAHEISLLVRTKGDKRPQKHENSRGMFRSSHATFVGKRDEVVVELTRPSEKPNYPPTLSNEREKETEGGEKKKE